MPRKPPWIKTRWPQPGEFNRINDTLRQYRINTVCRQARCPNIGGCYSRGYLTFMILGNICTRSCKFCSVPKGVPVPLDPDEINRIIEVTGILGLTEVIITSVTRDDLPDGGADLFRFLVVRLKEKYPGIKIEILTPDFWGNADPGILDASPSIWAHNVETVPRLYKELRPLADYERSLRLLKGIKSKRNDILTKSGIMLGLGEEKDEVVSVLARLRDCGVNMVTIGQYLQPDKSSVRVNRFLNPDEFNRYRDQALEMGFTAVMSAPLARSSYRGPEFADKREGMAEGRNCEESDLS